MMGRMSKTEIFTVYGQIEAVAAEIMIEDGRATKIERDVIPEEHTVNSLGQPARFAVMMPRRHVREFEKLIAELRW